MQRLNSLCAKSSFFDFAELEDPQFYNNQTFSLKFIHSVCNIPSFNDISDVVCKNSPEVEESFDVVPGLLHKIHEENPLELDSYMHEVEEKSIGSTYAPARSGSTESLAQTPQNHQVTLSPLSKKGTGCNCKKTGCLKMYCECFSSGRACTDQCNCHNCSNCDQDSDVVKKAKEVAKNKHRFAFSPLQGSTRKHCNCRKTQCQKKYCQCFNSGQACNQLCKCEDCLNGTHDPHQSHKDQAHALTY